MDGAKVIVGIDLGTTNSCLAIMEGDDVVVVSNTGGRGPRPPWSRSRRTGSDWWDRSRAVKPSPTQGTPCLRPSACWAVNTKSPVQELTRLLPYDLVSAKNGDVHVSVWDKTYSPSELAAEVLSKMKEAAEAYLGYEVRDAVITVPAYFDDAQRQATKDAGRIAGLNVLRIINEPTAATLAYGIGRDDEDERIVAVYDMGGGTFDISILQLRSGVFEVLATGGDTFLGGEDFDNAVVNWAMEEFKKVHGISLESDKLARQRLKEASEKAKQELSYALDTEINLPFIAQRSGQPIHLELRLTRGELEKLTGVYIERSLAPCRQAMEDAELEPSDIDEVILVGGQTRMPLIAERVSKFFNRDPHKGVNPDEVVAAGAAIQGAILSGDMGDVVLIDVAPLNIGVETSGGVFTTLIPKGTPIPTRKSEVFSTSVDNQPVVPVHVLQGLREMAVDNRSLARLQLTDIPPAPRGVPQIKVSFGIDANGILDVNAEDLASGRSSSMTVQPMSGLTDDEIDALEQEATSKRGSDEERRKLAELRNAGETLLYTCERSMEAFGSKLDELDRRDITADLQSLRQGLQASVALDRLQELIRNLESSSHQIDDAMMAEAEADNEDGQGNA